MKTWEPWLMDENGQRMTRIILTEPCRTVEDCQRFLRRLPLTHPFLVGEHIEFEEKEDKSPVAILVPRAKDYGYAGDEGDT